eukprot:1179384-Amorphochlora_amoeboformis.AAC.1
MPDNNVSGDPTKSPGYPAISEMEGRLGTTAGRVGVPHIVFLLVLWGFILLFSIVMTSGNVSSGIGLGGRVKGEGRGGTPLWRQRDIRNMRKHRSLASRRRESLAKPPVMQPSDAPLLMKTTHTAHNYLTFRSFRISS